ncbi:MAG TPA: YhcN/YlaJ family sporulation lipoprotein [Bacillota bacterium]|nr:YhcN/YlaJ family sporulation lipoprotein [Bacillota bacterium]
MRISFTSILIVLLITVGCSYNNTQNGGDDTMRTNELTPENNRSIPKDSELDRKLGFVHYTKDEIQNDVEENRDINIDRTEMANIITRNILRNDRFHEVATLVTSDQILIAYDKRDEADDHTSAEIARKTAMSIMPRFFDIYVSDNATLIDEIHSLHNSSVTDPNYDHTIEQIIEEMKKSPQGLHESDRSRE